MSSVTSSSSSVFDRASTPSSVSTSSSSDCSDNFGSHVPSIFVSFSSNIEPNLLKAVFETYAQNGYLGLCIASGEEQQTSLNFAQKEYVLPKGYSDGVEVLVSAPGEIPLGQDPTTYAVSSKAIKSSQLDAPRYSPL